MKQHYVFVGHLSHHAGRLKEGLSTGERQRADLSQIKPVMQPMIKQFCPFILLYINLDISVVNADQQ